MVTLHNLKTGRKFECIDVQQAKSIVNKEFPKYEDWETTLMNFAFDLDLNDRLPEITTFAILVNGVEIWNNKFLDV